MQRGPENPHPAAAAFSREEGRGPAGGLARTPEPRAPAPRRDPRTGTDALRSPGRCARLGPSVCSLPEPAARRSAERERQSRTPRSTPGGRRPPDPPAGQLRPPCACRSPPAPSPTDSTPGPHGRLPGKGRPGSTSPVRHSGPPGAARQDDLAHPWAHGRQKLVLKEPPLQGVSLAPLPGPVPQRPHAGPGPATATTATRGGPRGGAAQVRLPQLLLWGEEGPWGSWPGSAAGRPRAYPHYPLLLLGAGAGCGWETRRVVGTRVVSAAWGAAPGTKWPRGLSACSAISRGPEWTSPR